MKILKDGQCTADLTKRRRIRGPRSDSWPTHKARARAGLRRRAHQRRVNRRGGQKARRGA
jgi:hypothetical protein